MNLGIRIKSFLSSERVKERLRSMVTQIKGQNLAINVWATDTEILIYLDDILVWKVDMSSLLSNDDLEIDGVIRQGSGKDANIKSLIRKKIATQAIYASIITFHIAKDLLAPNALSEGKRTRDLALLFAYVIRELIEVDIDNRKIAFVTPKENKIRQAVMRKLNIAQP